MPLPQLTIDQTASKAPMHPARADVPLFVGLVARSASPIPAVLQNWIEASEYAGSGQMARSIDQQEALLDIPVPIDSFAEFEELFDWQARPLLEGSPDVVSTRLGLAVEQFFAEGGARCWVVRVGDPLPVLADAINDAPSETDIEATRALLSWSTGSAPADAADRAPLLPGFVAGDTACDPHDPATWRGAGHILGIDEAVYIALPDLPDLVSGPALRLPDPEFPVVGDEQFIPCAPEDTPDTQDALDGWPALRAPRLTLEGYRHWGRAVRHLLSMMAGRNSAAHRRDVIHVAALPLPAFDDPNMPGDANIWPLGLDDPALPDLGGVGLFSEELVGSGRQVLVYPWLETELTEAQPERICGGEGALIGLQARRTLAKGLHVVATGPLFSSVRATKPELPAEILRREPDSGPYGWIGDCCSLIGRRRTDIHVLSDVTTSRKESWRDGHTTRIMGALIRQARLVGQDIAFGPNGPASWSRAKTSLEQLLETFWRGDALVGGSPADAFQVRCDRSTMLQSDIDQGRVIAEVRFRPARTLQHIAVTLSVVGGAA